MKYIKIGEHFGDATLTGVFADGKLNLAVKTAGEEIRYLYPREELKNALAGNPHPCSSIRVSESNGGISITHIYDERINAYLSREELNEFLNYDINN